MEITEPSPEQMKQIFAMDHDGPVVFVNLLKFNPDGGAEGFAKYSEAFNKLMGPKGVKSVFQGKGLMSLIGNEEWDLIVAVLYPTIGTWQAMVQDEEYHKISHHRAGAISDARLIITEQF
tara:strand:- start:3270 stop:3629 length:360 start_codon:yes stop_codon:yes gene_type:complete